MRYTTAIILTLTLIALTLGCEQKETKPPTPLPEKQEVATKPTLSVKAPVTPPEAATPAAIEEEKGERPPAPDAPAEEPVPEDKPEEAATQPAAPSNPVTPTAEEEKPECGPDSADTDGIEAICEGDKVCDGNKCVDDPCLQVVCSDGNTYGCQVAGAVHFKGFTTEEEVRRYLLKLSKKDDTEGTKLAAFNEALVKALKSTYSSAYSYATAPAAVKEMKSEGICEGLQESMTRLDGVHLMYRIKRHDAAIRSINEDDAPTPPAPEPKVEAPKAPPKVMKAAPVPTAPTKLATPTVTPTPKGEERLVKLPVGLNKK